MASPNAAGPSRSLSDGESTRGLMNPGSVGEATDSSSGSSDDITSNQEEARLLRRLEIKRREIDEEIEAFKTAKQEEYAKYERRLRERKRRRRQYKQKVTANEDEARDGDVKHDGHAHSSAASAYTSTAKSHSHFEEEEPDTELPFAISSPAALRALHEQVSADHSANDSSSTASEPQAQQYKSPPFEEEIQRAGLFTPNFLPLLGDTYSRTSPVAVSPRPITPTSSGSSHNHSRPQSPSAPLASSLKTSASSGSSSASSKQLKPKSPKRVSFKLDETAPVPSRSTPPQTILTFTDQTEDPDVIAVEQVEQLDELSFSPRSAPMINTAMTKSVVVEALVESSSLLGDALVVPTKISDGLVEVAGGGQFRDGGISPRADNDDWESVDKGDVHGGFGAVDDDDDDEDLFDMDETLPISPTDEDGNTDNPGIRSTSPDFDADVVWAGVTAPSDIVATPHGLREAGSLPKFSPISPYGSLGIPQSHLPGRRGSMPFSFDTLQDPAVPTSLPSPGYAPGIKNPRQPNGTFRRKSVQKYVEDEDDTPPPMPSLKGKAIEGAADPHYAALLEEDEDEEVPPTTFGSSVPMTINRKDSRGVSKAKVIDEVSPGTGTAPGVSDESVETDSLDGHEGLPRIVGGDAPNSPDGLPMFPTDEDHEANSPTPISIDSAPNGDFPPPLDMAPVASHAIQFAQPFPSYSRSPTQDMVTPPRLSPASATPRPNAPSSVSSSLLAIAHGHSSSPRTPTATTRLTTAHNPPRPHQLLNPFATSPSPYATPFAARVAAEAAENGFNDGIGSVVGGVDGRTGLDPEISTQRRGSLALFQGIAASANRYGGSVNGRKRAVSSFVGGGAGGGTAGAGETGGGNGQAIPGLPAAIVGIPPENMSFSMRLALEEHVEKAKGPGGHGHGYGGHGHGHGVKGRS